MDRVMGGGHLRRPPLMNYHFYIKAIIIYILSRVGDRPTATILQAQFHFVYFCLVFYGKIFDQNMPLLEGPNIP